MSLKIGNLDIQAIKVGSADCKVYIGNELLYPSGFTGKFKATYASGPDYTLDCDGETTLSTGNTRPSGYEYSAMTEAVIGNCVTSIGSSAFEGCRSLTSIYIPSGVTSIGGATFSRCSGLTAIDIPNSVTRIGNNAFKNCSSLTSCTIGSGVTSIANGAFSGCSSLATIVIPSGLTSIDNNVFSGCRSLTSIYIPSGVTSIGGALIIQTTAQSMFQLQVLRHIRQQVVGVHMQAEFKQFQLHPLLGFSSILEIQLMV